MEVINWMRCDQCRKKLEPGDNAISKHFVMHPSEDTICDGWHAEACVVWRDVHVKDSNET